MEKKKEATHPMVYVAMVAIVAILAGVVLVLNWNSDRGNEEAIAGEAIAQKCPYCQWDNLKFCDLIADLPVRESVRLLAENGEILYDIKNAFMDLKSTRLTIGGGITGYLKSGEVVPLADGGTILIVGMDTVAAPWKTKLCLNKPGID